MQLAQLLPMDENFLLLFRFKFIKQPSLWANTPPGAKCFTNYTKLLISIKKDHSFQNIFWVLSSRVRVKNTKTSLPEAE